MNRNAPVVLAIIVGIAASVAAYTAVRNHNNSAAGAEFSSLASNHANLIVDGFNRALFAIQSVGALHNTFDEISRTQFADFAESLLQRFPTISALGWVPRVRHADREAFELAAQELFPGYRITERDEQNVLHAAAERDVYFPIYLMNPLAGNEAAHGFDLYSNSIRREAIDRAGETGQTISTARISLVQESERQFSVLLIHPVFDKRVSAPGRGALRGVASAVYRIGDGVEQVLSRVDPAGLDIWLFDRSGEPGRQFLYFHRARGLGGRGEDAEALPRPGARTHVREFELGGRRFELVMAPAYGRLDGGRGYLAWLALIIGLVFTVLLAAYLSLVLRRSRELMAGHRTLEHQIGERKAIERKLRKANQQLEVLTREDPLMGIANRRCFDGYFEQEWKRAVRHGTSLSLLLGDVDYFKSYNDSYGHRAGDECLRKIARVLSDALERPGDLAARYGGEEVALVLPSTSEAGAYELAEKIRLSVAELGLAQESSPVAGVVTISFGCGTIVPAQSSSMNGFLQAVDAALYRAKQRGRNRTVSIGTAV